MPSKKHKPSTPQAIHDCHQILLWIIPVLDQFPRSRRFTLGERIESGLLYVLECLIEAAYTRAKNTPLVQANRRLEVVRHLWRLAYELKTISLRRYELGIKQLLDLGRQIGGWEKSLT